MYKKELTCGSVFIGIGTKLGTEGNLDFNYFMQFFYCIEMNNFLTAR